MFGLNAHAVTAPLCPRNVRSSVGSSEWNASFAIGTPPKRTIVGDGVWSRASRARVCGSSIRFSDRLFERAPISTRVHRERGWAHNLVLMHLVRGARSTFFSRRRRRDDYTRAPSRSRLRLLVSVSPSLSPLSVSVLSQSSLSLHVFARSSRTNSLGRHATPSCRRRRSRRVPSSPPRVSPASPRPTSPIASRPRRRPTCVPSFYHRPTVRISRPTPRTASRRRARRRRADNAPVSPVRASRATTRASWRPETSKRRSVSSTHPSSDTKILSDVSVSDGSIGRRRKRNTRPRTRARRERVESRPRRAPHRTPRGTVSTRSCTCACEA